MQSWRASKPSATLSEREDRDIRREQGIEAAQRGSLTFMRGDLRPGVHARVGAARDRERHGPAQHGRQGGFELTLDRALARLEGPAGEGGAVVLDRQPRRHRRGAGTALEL